MGKSFDTAMEPNFESQLVAAREHAKQYLGPASLAHLARPQVISSLKQRFEIGSEVADAVLAEIHLAAQHQPLLANEFIGCFLSDMMMLGSATSKQGLRRLLDTNDLVQSVIEDLWPELSKLKFTTRAAFLSLLSRRLQWKASDRRRMLGRDKRREDLRLNVEPQDVSPKENFKSPLSIMDDREEQDLLLTKLMDLPELDRRLVTLHLRGHSVVEMSEILEMERAETDKELQRALRRVRGS